ncbi:MAG: hypothetical protein U0165_00595 [Polyangiaceae bacterium]
MFSERALRANILLDVSSEIDLGFFILEDVKALCALRLDIPKDVLPE